MATPHISAQPGDFAPAVLMPGDPKRATKMAELLMPDAQMVSNVRGIVGYTGEVNGKPLSIMASGMGQPSLSIYVNELFMFYDVERIIRVGTAGGLSPKVNVGDVIIANGAHYEGVLNTYMAPSTHFSAIASYQLVRGAADAAGDDETVHVGTIVSRDRFYGVDPAENEALAKIGCLGVEMEAGALYGLATKYDRHALSVLTVSDHITVPGPDMDAQERESKFQKALALAVAAAHC
ncbi:DeoD-type purine-nucleoside phosphorylase [Arcanobacterium pinnipediorum]|uniref:Uridine phosphorylase n=1 Tax=Arcanobacterium pinnipediorum TaxID=1503041 RepID=A0ABY5AFW7_9ACTO|nr:purine-nucleoside phosphorylase [Arcanobacterium pinnipediorum]USR78765.1 purine-nucleoside phosphorylase [Arcanobacterium pinnipediorum]